MREICNENKTLVITQNGEAKVVVQDLESYEQTQDSLAMLKILAQSTKSKNDSGYKSSKQTFQSVRSQVKNLK